MGIKLYTSEIPKFTTEDLLLLRHEVNHVLRGRKREALRAFREENPILGKTVLLTGENETYVGFWEVGKPIPYWVIKKLETHGSGEVINILNPQLKDLLCKASQDEAILTGFVNANTANGKEWDNTDLTIEL